MTAPEFGTLKGKIKLLDPKCFDAMTDEEADSFLYGYIDESSWENAYNQTKSNTTGERATKK